MATGSIKQLSNIGVTHVAVQTDTVISIGPFVRMGVSSPINGTIISVIPSAPTSGWLCLAEIDSTNESRFFLFANGDTNIRCAVLYEPTAT